jgi:cellulose biosynthesis protein BcsQ
MASVKIISIFNNKGGVGKTTLSFHTAHALAHAGKRVLVVDLDPQCNLTIYGLAPEKVHEIWAPEDMFIESPGFEASRKQMGPEAFDEFNRQPRSIHYLLRPAEEGTGEPDRLPPPVALADNLDILPGRLTLHLYEDKVGTRWSDLYQGDPLAVRTVTRVRELIHQYSEERGYEIVLLDTSPSLGALNKVAIYTADGFVIPCSPDMFSLYGIRNIGNSLRQWKTQFNTIYSLISEEKRARFPKSPVRFLGYTVYNARRYGGLNDLDLAQAHYNFAKQIPPTIKKYISPHLEVCIDDETLALPIGGTAVMHSHNTLPSMAQKYRLPMWNIPACKAIDAVDQRTITGNRGIYEATRDRYGLFAADLLSRMEQSNGGSDAK